MLVSSTVSMTHLPTIGCSSSGDRSYVNRSLARYSYSHYTCYRICRLSASNGKTRKRISLSIDCVNLWNFHWYKWTGIADFWIEANHHFFGIFAHFQK